MAYRFDSFYIGGTWVKPSTTDVLTLEIPPHALPLPPSLMPRLPMPLPPLKQRPQRYPLGLPRRLPNALS